VRRFSLKRSCSSSFAGNGPQELTNPFTLLVEALA
jgi:hypothetical protein